MCGSCVVLVGGRVCSGKSKLVQELVGWFGKKVETIVLDELWKEWNPTGWDHQQYSQVTEQFKEKIESWISCHHYEDGILIIENTFHLKQHRFEIFRQCRLSGISYVEILLKISPELSLLRNEKRPSSRTQPIPILKETIMNMPFDLGCKSKRMQDRQLILDQDYSIETVVEFILKWENVAMEKPSIKYPTSSHQTKAHQFDLELRRKVSYFVEKAISQSKKQLIPKIMHLKKDAEVHGSLDNFEQQCLALFPPISHV